MRISLRKVHRRPLTADSKYIRLKAFRSEPMNLKRSHLQYLWELAESTLGKDLAPTQQELEVLLKAFSEFKTTRIATKTCLYPIFLTCSVS